MYEFKTKREPFGRGYINSDAEYIGKKLAAGYVQMAKEMDISIDTELGTCNAFQSGATGLRFGNGPHCWLGDDLSGYPEDERDDIQLIHDVLWKDFRHQHLWDDMPEDCKEHHAEGHLWGGTWIGHAVPEYNDIAKYGTAHIRRVIAEWREKKPGNDEFYDSCDMAMEAIDILGKRFGDLAEEMLKTETDPAVIRRLEIIRDMFDHAPVEPCRDFAEAVIMFTMVFSLDGIDSPGYFDQYMYDFWKVTDKDLRREYLENIWHFFHKTRSWNLCIAGSDENWNDRSNDLTYEILDVTAKYKFQTPNLTMRCHRNTPPELLKAAYKAISSGCGMPTLYNDEAVCPALERLGIPPCDSHLYVMNGCNQIDIQGKSHMGLEDGEVNLAKAVEFTLFNGVSGKSGKKLGLETGDPCDFKDWDEFYAAFIKQLDNLTDISTKMSNYCQERYAETALHPLRSVLIEGCLEKAKDYKRGGPLYGHGQILSEAVADCIDSLAAVKKYVYEDKKFTMAELVAALNANFEEYDDMYRFLKNTELKFGNDIEFVDNIARDVVDHFNNYLLTIPTFRGGWFGGGCSPFTRAPHNGRALGCLPNGHKKCEEIVADSLGATPGCDTNGPTALLNSVLSFDHKLATSGFILNVKYDKDMFNSEAGEEAFYALYHSYFDRCGQQLSVSVVSAEELLDAQVNPDAHRDLIVRVGGYSDYFVNLPRDLQENVIARTNYNK